MRGATCGLTVRRSLLALLSHMYGRKQIDKKAALIGAVAALVLAAVTGTNPAVQLIAKLRGGR